MLLKSNLWARRPAVCAQLNYGADTFPSQPDVTALWSSTLRGQCSWRIDSLSTVYVFQNVADEQTEIVILFVNEWGRVQFQRRINLRSLVNPIKQGGCTLTYHKVIKGLVYMRKVGSDLLYQDEILAVRVKVEFTIVPAVEIQGPVIHLPNVAPNCVLD